MIAGPHRKPGLINPFAVFTEWIKFPEPRNHLNSIRAAIADVHWLC